MGVNRRGRGKRSTAYLQTLDARELQREIHYAGPDSKPYRRRVWHALLHVPNHQTARRAQIAALLTRAGVAPPPTGLVVFLKAE